jgi:hypothetical protein
MIPTAVGPPLLGLVVPAVLGFLWYVGHDLHAQIVVVLAGLVGLPMAFAILYDIWRRWRPNST